MPIIPIIVVVFGAAGTILALYLRFTVKSPILQTEDGKDVDTRGLSIQQILNLVFTYFVVLHLVITLVGINFLLAAP
ncbi:hypothetical protein IIA29_06845 [candidate division KSB1 bacterium]|nr:hypothetical protein [candidate division KSB1 bacterium]